MTFRGTPRGPSRQHARGGAYAARSASAHLAVTASCRSVARAAVGDHGRPWVGPSMTHRSPADTTRISSHALRCCHAHWSISTSRRLPPSAQRAAPGVQIALSETVRFADSHAARPSTAARSAPAIAGHAADRPRSASPRRESVGQRGTAGPRCAVGARAPTTRSIENSKSSHARKPPPPNPDPPTQTTGHLRI